MILWALLAVYVAGWIWGSRKLAAYFVSSMEDENDSGMILLDRLLGSVAAILWPLVLTFLLVTARLPRTDKQLRAELAEHKAQLAERDDHIAQLERELEVGSS